MKGVRDPRYSQPISDDIEDPRPDANRDLIAADRRWLVARSGGRGADGGDRNTRRTPGEPPSTAYGGYLKTARVAPSATGHGSPSARDRGDGRETSNEERADRDADLTLVQYRYTKAPEVVNDEMGYGERIGETFWQLRGGSLSEVRRVSQRTKSGRQVLKV